MAPDVAARVSPSVARIFDAAALEANRSGRIAPSQAARLRRTIILRVIGYVVSGALAFMLYLARAEATGTVGVAIGVIVMAVLAVALLVLRILPPLADLRGGRVERVAGPGAKATWTATGSLSARFGIVIGDRRFEVTRGMYDALPADASLVAHVLPRTGGVLTVDVDPA